MRSGRALGQNTELNLNHVRGNALYSSRDVTFSSKQICSLNVHYLMINSRERCDSFTSRPSADVRASSHCKIHFKCQLIKFCCAADSRKLIKSINRLARNYRVRHNVVDQKFNPRARRQFEKLILYIFIIV